MSKQRCPRCNGVIRAPSRKVKLDAAIEHHEDSCPGTTKPRSS